MSRTRALLIFVLAAVPAIVGAVLLIAQAMEPEAANGDPTVAAAAEVPLPPVVYARELCTLANDDARSALIQGFDGGSSIVVGGKTWWTFGDTLFAAESGKQIEQNTIAWSDGLRPDGCPRLHYYAPNGVAVPFLQKDGSLTVWPSGAWAVDDHSFDFYTAYVYGSGPYAYTIGEVGLARLDTESMQVTILARRLWDDTSGFPAKIIGAQPVDLDDDGRLRVVLITDAGTELVARVRPDAMEDASAYESWDGERWAREEAAAAPLWDHVQPADPVHRLASFENGANVAWNEGLRRYVAVVNIGFDDIGVRTAERLEGPWSDPVPWLDCSAFAEPYVPTCYSPFQHPQLASDDGRTFVLTLTRFRIYDVVAYEVRLGVPIHEFRSQDGRIAYTAASPDDGWTDEGVAFYASDVPLDGFEAVYAWQRGDETRYAGESPGSGFSRGKVAFYAAAAPNAGTSIARYRPVYEWRSGTTARLSRRDLTSDGFTRGDIAFYAP